MSSLEYSARLTFGLTDLCAASGATPAQVNHWVRLGIVVPVKAVGGKGLHRLYVSENTLEATQALELTRAGYSATQIKRAFAAQHARLTSLSPAERLVLRFKMYIGTITALAETFGRGPGFDQWVKTQTRVLKQMEQDVARLGADAGHELDARLLSRVGSLTAPDTDTPLLAD